MTARPAFAAAILTATGTLTRWAAVASAEGSHSDPGRDGLFDCIRRSARRPF